MAITDIEIIQDNKIGSCNLMACHSPMIFLIDVTFTGAFPDNIYCYIYWANNLIATYKCIYHCDVSLNVHRYKFIADDILRGYMDDFDDFAQTEDTALPVSNIIRMFRLIFSGGFSGSPTDDVFIQAAHSIRQLGNNIAMTDIFNNDSDFYVAGKNKPVYIYFYNDLTSNTLKINDEVISGLQTQALFEDFSSWTGTGYNTRPSGWTILTDVPVGEFWRMYESPAGVGKCVFQDNLYKRYYIYHTTELDPDKEYYVKLKYRSNADCNDFLLGYHVPYGIGYLQGHYLPSTSGAWDEVYLNVFNSSEGIGEHRFAFGFFQAIYAQDKEVDIDEITLYEAESHIGYYRLKVDDLTADTTYVFKKNDVVSGTKYVRVKDFCTDDKYIKYLDRNGQYRFQVFNRFWESRDDPVSLGKTNKMITSILSAQSTSENIGYKNERKMILVADDLSEDELEKLSDIYTSPRVLLQIGETDQAKDWLKVEVEATRNLVRARKQKFNSIEIEITLPEWFTIKMI